MKIVRCGEGYNDFYRKRGKAETVTFWKRSLPSDYLYNQDTGDIYPAPGGTGKGEFDSFTVDVPIQESDDLFEKEFSTPDFYIAKPGVMGAMLQAYITAMTTMANVEIRISPDSNIDESDDYLKINISQPEMTGSFANSTVRFAGRRRMEVESILSNTRISSRVRFDIRIRYDDSGYDDSLITSFTMLSDNILFIEGGSDAAD